MNAPLLSARAVSRRYVRGSEVVVAVDLVTVELHAGTTYLLEGPSGSGKTSLLNLLAGWEQPDAGGIEWEGRPIDPRDLRWEHLAVVPQRVGLLPELTIEENVTLPFRLKGATHFDVTATLRALALGDLNDALPDELSAGQQQRASVARALVAAPRVLLVDEPTSSQDEESARLVLGGLGRAAESGSACLIASHDPIAVEFADSVLEMRDGRLGS